MPQRLRPPADRAALLLDCRAYELVSAANAADTTSSPTSSRARSRPAHSRSAATACSTRCTTADPRDRRQSDQPRPRPVRRRTGRSEGGPRGTSASGRRHSRRGRSGRYPSKRPTTSRRSPSAARRSALPVSRTAPRNPGPAPNGDAWCRAWRARSILGRPGTGRLRRQGALRRRHPPGLRLDHPVRARRQRRRRIDLRPRPGRRHDPCRLQESRTPRGRRTMTGAAGSPSSTSPTTARDRRRPARLDRLRRQQVLASLHEHRGLRPTRSTWLPARPPAFSTTA